jgi:uncharacterized protein with PIN domain
MPDKDPERLKPATDLLMNSSQQVASDRARRINSLHKQVNGLLQEETKKRRQVGSEVGAIIQQQQDLRKELQYSRDEISADVASGYGKVVNNLANTIKQMSIGMKNISLSTAQASADAISQYGKAIGQDISINKTNTIAMALSRATPIFGYFAAKFMETDVFRGAISKIRQGVGSAMLAGLRGAGSSISNIFRGKSVSEKVSGRERELGALSSEVASLKKELQAKPPQLQAGGYVKKGGVVQVHAAEVIAPIDSLVKQIVETTQKQQRTFMKTFIKEFKKGGTSKEQAWQDRMLKALLELKVAFIGTTSRLRIAWQRTLLENPAFRGMLLFAEGFKAVLGAPIKWLFGARGGYLSDVKRATSTDNVFLKIANMLGVTYTMMMPKLDAIAKYTRVSATVAAGYEPSAPIKDKYTMFQKVKTFIKDKKKGKGEGAGLKEMGVKKMWQLLGVEEEELKGFKEAGGFKGVFDVAKEGATGYKEKGKDLFEKGKEGASEGIKKTKDFFNDINIIRKLKEKQEDREKPKSPSWVQYLGMSYGKAKQTAQDLGKQTKTAAESYIEVRKSRKANEAQLSFLGRMTKRLKRLGGWAWKLVMLAFNMFQGAISMGVSAIGVILGPLLSALGIRGLFKKGGKGFIKTAGEGLKKGKKGIGKFAGKTADVGKKAGGKAAAKYAGKTALKTGLGFAGRVAGGAAKIAGGAAGIVTGVGFGLWDAFSAMRAGESPEGFVGGWLARGISGFLGGKDSGASGALSGALKLGGLGAGIGSFVPIIGTAIGGAIGAAAGAILGFIGGKRISKGISAVLKPLKKIIGAWWAYVSFPFKFIKEMVKLVKFYFTDHPMGKKILKAAKWAAKEAMLLPFLPIRAILWMRKKVKAYIGEKWDQMVGWFSANKDTWFGKTFFWIRDIFVKISTWFTDIRDGIHKWFAGLIEKIKNIPFIGKFIKGVKEIHAGTFAEKRKSEWKSKEHFGKVAPAAAGGVMRPFELQKRGKKRSLERHVAAQQSAHYARKILGAEHIIFKDGKASLAKIDGKWYKIKIDNSGMPQEIIGEKKVVRDIMDPDDETWHRGVVTTPVKAEVYKRKATADELQNVAETISNKMDETSDKSSKVAIGNTTLLTNTITNNTSNTASGGGGGVGATRDFWGSGATAANDVTYSVLN